MGRNMGEAEVSVTNDVATINKRFANLFYKEVFHMSMYSLVFYYFINGTVFLIFFLIVHY